MIDITRIREILPHRYPFLFVDRILEFEPGKRIVGLKNVTVNEPFFQGHFPDFPILPGVVIIEAMAQTGGIFVFALNPEDAENKNLFFSGIDKARFRKPVVPGDQLILELELLKQRGYFWKFRGKATVNGEVVAEAELLASIIDKNPRLEGNSETPSA
ncbi:MAG: 3-hydroxyacyl-ACP dehydratase FabZ [Deltaproteobacteria bacterium]|nr:3-hydroxyacyl-ACP dehydratase FabZ [Deltaproteobacteria bacterium]